MELKDVIHHYLGTGLKVYIQYPTVKGAKTYDIKTMTGVYVNQISLDHHIKTSDGTDYLLSDVKVLFLPFSDLTKEIEIDSDKFVPIDKLKSNCSPWEIEEDYAWFLDGNFDTWCDEDIGDVPYKFMTKIFQWHLNAFNLDQKYWINVKTLKKNPYA